ncbi:hypothetical protein OGATHE_001356 [Ogataea polymorpha]|uniref:Uncharacterized protein n=1 Tax=Ogataea polymorpha TaxID=460523 RepID=A0A9P8TFW1_9ASCO|nr:hypothetical protein OGATHE_001356 [Ogataea polymorpha]
MQTRTKSNIDEITRQIGLRHRSPDHDLATARRSGTFSGILTDQLNDYLTNIHSGNAVLGYDQPISKQRLPTVTISRINEISPQLRLVEIDHDKVVALACFKPIFNVKLRVDDRVHLGSAFYCFWFEGAKIQCYYRCLWHRLYSLWIIGEYLNWTSESCVVDASVIKPSASICDPATTITGNSSCTSFSVSTGLKVSRMAKIRAYRLLNTAVSVSSPSWNSADCSTTSTSLEISLAVTSRPLACLALRWFSRRSSGQLAGSARCCSFSCWKRSSVSVLERLENWDSCALELVFDVKIEFEGGLLQMLGALTRGYDHEVGHLLGAFVGGLLAVCATQIEHLDVGHSKLLCDELQQRLQGVWRVGRKLGEGGLVEHGGFLWRLAQIPRRV